MKCSICNQDIKKEASGWDQGNNAQPINDGRCCNGCNNKIVIPSRIVIMNKRKIHNSLSSIEK